MTVTLSAMQSRALAAIRDWYVTRRHEQQVFRVFGYAGTGKTTTTANMAVVLAEAGYNVLVVNCDYRLPKLHQYFRKSHISRPTITFSFRPTRSSWQPAPLPKGCWHRPCRSTSIRARLCFLNSTQVKQPGCQPCHR